MTNGVAQTEDFALGIFGLFFVIAAAWGLFFYSSVSLLYSRTEQIESGSGALSVTCHYFNATGQETIWRPFFGKASADQYFCPRWKPVGS